MNSPLKTPPFLVGAALLFWGWQTGFEIAGALMALALESSRWIKSRWDLSDDDFSRIWTFCTLLFLASTVYAFTANEGPNQFRSLFENPNFVTQRNAGTATARTAAALFRWLPLVFFLFAAAQAFSTREGVPIETISLILRKRWKRARKAGYPVLSGHTVNIAYYYFGLCLFAAAVHTAEDSTSYFWGLAVLLGYSLWWHRPQRFSAAAWAMCLSLAVVGGYFGQRSAGQLQGYLGNFNPLFLAAGGRLRHDPLKSRTDLGRVGRIKASSRIVIRLASDGVMPPLLREASYRRFNGETWFADLSEKDYSPVFEESLNSGSYQLLRGKTNTIKVNIGCYLDGGHALLPLPAGTARLEHLTAFTLSKSPLGGVYEEGPGVVVFDAFYGPGATIDASPEPEYDLRVPQREQDAVDQSLAEVGLSGDDPQKAIKTLTAWFNENFTYSTFQAPVRSRGMPETPLSRFLLRTRRGHCEYFACAGVLLLRRLGIPTRYAVGYAVHEGANGKYVVRQRDAHAWCIIWDEKHRTWRDVDFTPPSWVEMESAGHGWWQRLSDFWSRVSFELSKFRWGQTHLRQYILIAVVPVLLILLAQIISRTRKRRKAAAGGRGRENLLWPGLDSDFYQIEQALLRRGLSRLPSEPLSGWLERALRETGDRELQTPLRQLLLLHYRYRFDPRGLSNVERDLFRLQTRDCLQKLRAGV